VLFFFSFFLFFLRWLDRQARDFVEHDQIRIAGTCREIRRASV